MFHRYLKSHCGQGMSEYLILVLLIAVGSIAVATQVGGTVKSKLALIHRKLQNVTLESVDAAGDGTGDGSGKI